MTNRIRRPHGASSCPLLRQLGTAALLVLGLHGGAAAGQERLAPPAGQASAFSSGASSGILSLPPASDRRPAGIVVVMHDALGPDQRSARYVDQLLGARIAVVEMQLAEHGAASLATVLAGLADDPRTQGLRIGVLGFGAGALVAGRLEGPVVGRALLYPGCQSLALPDNAGPHAVFLAHGTEDAANATDACAAAASRLTRAGMTVRHLVYADAGYAWDHPAYGMEQRILLPRPDGGGRIPVAPWPELTAMAASQVAAFFSAAFQAVP